MQGEGVVIRVVIHIGVEGCWLSFSHELMR